MRILSRETPFTAFFAVFSFSMSVLIYFGVIDVYQVYYNRELVFKNHEYWRLFTSLFFFGPISFDVIIAVICFLQYCSTTESAYFSGRPLDFLLFCLWGFTWLWVYSYFRPLIFIGQGVSSFFTYYSAKRAPEAIVIAFIFPVPMPAPYINLFFLVLHIVTKQYAMLMMNIIGYLSAHAYYYLQDILSLKYGINMLTAPRPWNDALNKMFR